MIMDTAIYQMPAPTARPLGCGYAWRVGKG
jgi:hypothetical protein